MAAAVENSKSCQTSTVDFEAVEVASLEFSSQISNQSISNLVSLFNTKNMKNTDLICWRYKDVLECLERSYQGVLILSAPPSRAEPNHVKSPLIRSPPSLTKKGFVESIIFDSLPVYSKPSSN